MSNQSAAPAAPPSATEGLLSKERIVARPGFNRWLVPPAALAILVARTQLMTRLVEALPD